MYAYDLAIALATGLINLPAVNAAVPRVQDLGAVTILSDNDLAGNLTTRTAGALLLPPSSYEAATKSCASLNEQLWSPSTSNFSLGLDNALSYDAYTNAEESCQYYWVDSPKKDSSCNSITTNGTLASKSCDTLLPALCTNSGPILSSGESDTRPELQVSVQSGKQIFTGFRDRYTFQFRGIRFSPKPERFTFSTLYEEPGEFDALEYGAGCPQAPDPRWPKIDEDCYFLNVWTPYLSANASSGAKTDKLKAVMVWLYGGGNIYGTGTDTEKEGGNLASRGDVVVVSFNYRVGNLGYLPFNNGVNDGNYGLSDALTALRWVKRNIASFGGDPSRVTIWGESAGADNVRTLLAVPQVEDEGLIAGAIMQSSPGEIGALGYMSQYETPADIYNTVTKKVLSESGCDTASDAVACLSAYDPLKWTTQYGGPIRDSKLLFTRSMPVAGPLAHAHKIPIMIGTMRDEYDYYFEVPTSNFTQNLALLTKIGGYDVMNLTNSSFAPDRSPLWPSLSEAEKEAAVFNASGSIVTGLMYTCLTHAFAYSAEKNGVFSSTHEFQFNRSYSPARFDGFSRTVCGRDVPNPDQDEYLKCHAGDVPYSFGNILQQGWPDRDGLDTPFAQLIVDIWSGFARTGGVEVEEGFLAARGFASSLKKWEEIKGQWKSSSSGEIMRLQWTGLGPFSVEETQVECADLGLPKDFYERYDYAGKSS